MHHVAANRVNRAGVGAHDDSTHSKRRRCQHHLLTSGNGINRNKLRLDDLLKICDFMLKEYIVVNQAMAVILDADKIFET